MRGCPSCLTATLVALPLVAGAPAIAGEAAVLCTVVVEADSGTVLRRDGDCAGRVTPASTFKIAIALMGYEAGILESATAPEWPFRPGYPAWIASWRRAHTPETWMRESVVWYSQEVTRRLGARRFAGFVRDFGYGNADVSGDPGAGNGLTRAWLSSSLRISPDEQVAFLSRLLAGALPLKPATVAATTRLIDQGERPGGWRIYGKTGTGPIKGGPTYGWFVGWAEGAARRIVFARLVSDGDSGGPPAGFVARDGLLAELFPPR